MYVLAKENIFELVQILNAGTNYKNASVSTSIKATVENIGNVMFDKGWIKSETGEDLFFEAVNLSYEDGILGLNNCIWTVNIGEEEVYNGKAGDSKELQHKKFITAKPKSLTISAEIDSDTAKSLIGKDVIRLNFIVFNNEQEEALESSSQVFSNGRDSILTKDKYEAKKSFLTKSKNDTEELYNELLTDLNIIIADITKCMDSAQEKAKIQAQNATALDKATKVDNIVNIKSDNQKHTLSNNSFDDMPSNKKIDNEHANLNTPNDHTITIKQNIQDSINDSTNAKINMIE